MLRTARDYSKLTAADITLLITSLRRYDYGTDAAGADWRDRYTAALERGDLPGAYRVFIETVAGAYEPPSCS